APEPARPGPRRARSARRLLGLVLLALLLTAAVAAAIAVSSSTSNTVVHLRSVAGHDLQTVVSNLQQLISQNTK
ncbi:MAG: hypothetical protein M3Z27_01465, partial [Actinomycetota bacterium]|nr:hypothetical protein [Actinomycetota bacterium]